MPSTLYCLQQPFENVLYYPHFTGEKTEAQRKEAICLRSHVQKMKKSESQSVFSGFVSHILNYYST